VLFDGFYVQADVGGYRLFLTDGPQRKHDEISRRGLIARYAIVNHLSIFVGGGVPGAAGERADGALRAGVRRGAGALIGRHRRRLDGLPSVRNF